MVPDEPELIQSAAAMDLTIAAVPPPPAGQVPIQPQAMQFKPRVLRTRNELMAYDTESETWEQQLSRRYTHHAQLSQILNNIEDVPESLYAFFKFSVTPFVAQLMDLEDPQCPIRRQYMPSVNELVVQAHEVRDSLAEDQHAPQDSVPVVHRYPRRILFLVHNTCGSYCRYCTRKRMVSDPKAAIFGDAIEAGLHYIARHPEIDDVLLSGGDPLVLSDRQLDYILGRIRSDAPHVRLLRIGTRLPVQLPTRITSELCSVLERHNVQMLNLHINHPLEITDSLARRISMLRRAGLMLGNHSVLLRGINDSIAVQHDLCMRLVEIGVRPYYVYSNDAAEGNWQFTVPYAEMQRIVHGLRGWVSGPAVPTFVVDGIGGLGKMPVQSEYLSEDKTSGEVWGINYRGQRARQPHLETGISLGTLAPKQLPARPTEKE